MTLPNMKIWTGGDREYSERVQRALFELGVRWMTGDTEVRELGAHWLTVGFLADEKLSFDFHDLNEGAEGLPAYRLADNGNLVPQEADDEGWIEWSGGAWCPVKPDTLVDVMYSDGVGDSDRADRYRWAWSLDQAMANDITHYRVPSQVFETSQQLERKPVHQMKHGDYILREDIPDEATFQRVCEVLEGQGQPMEDSFNSYEGWPLLRLCITRHGAGWFQTVPGEKRRITPADLGITTDTQETDMTPCEKKGLREGQWVWHNGLNKPARKGWIRLTLDDGSPYPFFADADGDREVYSLHDSIDWSAGIHNENPETGDGMSETLTEAQALREVAQGYEDGDENPWKRVQRSQNTSFWDSVNYPSHFHACLKDGDNFRRKPRTRRIEGEISEEAAQVFELISEEGTIENVTPQGLQRAAEQIFHLTQDQ